MSIIKRKKQDQFFMMSNAAAQRDLESLGTIGLLAYIISLPADFRLYKTFLYRKFTRRTVDNAFAELVAKRYILGFSMYVDRKKEYFYLASDEQLSESEFNLFVKDCYFDIVISRKLYPKNAQPIKDNPFEISPDLLDLFSDVQNEQHSRDQLVQHLESSSSSTVPDEQLKRYSNKDILERNNKNSSNIAPVPFYNWLEN